MNVSKTTGSNKQKMLFKSVVFLAALATVMAGKIDNGAFRTANNRIFNGMIAIPEEFPFMASLVSPIKREHFCGGVILSSQWVLTRGMCTYRRGTDFSVAAGSTVLQSGATYNVVSRVVFAPGFVAAGQNAAQHDLSLVQTYGSFQFGSLINSISFTSDIVGSGVSAVVAGWGQFTVSSIDF